MTMIAIVPEPAESGEVTFRAISGRQQSVGKTAGEALDRLTSLVNGEETPALVIVQRQHPDRHFTVEQQARLRQLMRQWRAARDGGAAFSPAEQAELESLANAEVQAAGQRAAMWLRELEQ